MTLDYPAGYNIPVFPEGKSIAIARWMSIGILAIGLLIIISCGTILWASRSRTIDPLILSVNSITGQWEVIGHQHLQNEYTADQMLQIAAINSFVQNWFLISSDMGENDLRWQKCAPDDCVSDADSLKDTEHLYGDLRCSMFCATDTELFEEFYTNVVPKYRLRAENGEYWSVNINTVQIAKTNVPGVWRITATVASTVQSFRILAYAKMERSETHHINTDGYYVTDFDSYRIQ